MVLADLPMDALHVVLAFLSPVDAVALSRTCWCIHRKTFAYPRFLQMCTYMSRYACRGATPSFAAGEDISRLLRQRMALEDKAGQDVNLSWQVLVESAVRSAKLKGRITAYAIKVDTRRNGYSDRSMQQEAVGKQFVVLRVTLYDNKQPPLACAMVVVARCSPTCAVVYSLPDPDMPTEGALPYLTMHMAARTRQSLAASTFPVVFESDLWTYRGGSESYLRAVYEMTQGMHVRAESVWVVARLVAMGMNVPRRVCQPCRVWVTLGNEASHMAGARHLTTTTGVRHPRRSPRPIIVWCAACQVAVGPASSLSLRLHVMSRAHVWRSFPTARGVTHGCPVGACLVRCLSAKRAQAHAAAHSRRPPTPRPAKPYIVYTPPRVARAPKYVLVGEGSEGYDELAVRGNWDVAADATDVTWSLMNPQEAYWRLPWGSLQWQVSRMYSNMAVAPRVLEVAQEHGAVDAVAAVRALTAFPPPAPGRSCRQWLAKMAGTPLGRAAAEVARKDRDRFSEK